MLSLFLQEGAACIQVSRFPVLWQNQQRKLCIPKEQEKIYKQFAWAEELAAHTRLAI